MTDYDFINPDAPEKRAKINDEEYPEVRKRSLALEPLSDSEVEQELEDANISAEEIVEELETDADTDNPAEGDSGIVSKLISSFRSLFK